MLTNKSSNKTGEINAISNDLQSWVCELVCRYCLLSTLCCCLCLKSLQILKNQIAKKGHLLLITITKFKKNINVTERASKGVSPLTVKYDNIANQLSTKSLLFGLLQDLFFIYLFGVLHRFQHSTGHITTTSWNVTGNQYIELIRDVYCKLPTNGKQLPAFPLEAALGIKPRTLRWEVRVLPLSHHGPCLF